MGCHLCWCEERFMQISEVTDKYSLVTVSKETLVLNLRIWWDIRWQNEKSLPSAEDSSAPVSGFIHKLYCGGAHEKFCAIILYHNEEGLHCFLSQDECV